MPALRNARRCLAEPAAQADTANADLLAHADGERFVTRLPLGVAPEAYQATGFQFEAG